VLQSPRAAARGDELVVMGCLHRKGTPAEPPTARLDVTLLSADGDLLHQTPFATARPVNREVNTSLRISPRFHHMDRCSGSSSTLTGRRVPPRASLRPAPAADDRGWCVGPPFLVRAICHRRGAQATVEGLGTSTDDESV
jgi:hypothetical protein